MYPPWLLDEYWVVITEAGACRCIQSLSTVIAMQIVEQYVIAGLLCCIAK